MNGDKHTRLRSDGDPSNASQCPAVGDDGFIRARRSPNGGVRGSKKRFVSDPHEWITVRSASIQRGGMEYTGHAPRTCDGIGHGQGHGHSQGRCHVDTSRMYVSWVPLHRLFPLLVPRLKREKVPHRGADAGCGLTFVPSSQWKMFSALIPIPGGFLYTARQISHSQSLAPRSNNVSHSDSGSHLSTVHRFYFSHVIFIAMSMSTAQMRGGTKWHLSTQLEDLPK